MRRSLYLTLIMLLGIWQTGCEPDTSYTHTLQQADSLLKAYETDSAYTLLEQVYDDCITDGSDNEKMQANYLMGRTYTLKGEAPQAMSYYLKACDYGDTTREDCDLRILSRIHAHMAYLYMQQDAPRIALGELDITDKIARKSGETLMVINNLEQCGEAYGMLEITDSVLALRQESAERREEQT